MGKEYIVRSERTQDDEGKLNITVRYYTDGEITNPEPFLRDIALDHFKIFRQSRDLPLDTVEILETKVKVGAHE